MIKVLHLRCSSNLLGAETVILELASSNKYGYEPIVGVIHDIRDPYPELATIAESRNQKTQVFSASCRIDFQCINNIKRYIHEQNIDIIHTHGYREDLYALFAASGRKICATNHLWKKTNFTLKLYAWLDSVVMSQIDRVIAVSQPILVEMEESLFISNNKLSMISNGIDTIKYKPGKVSTIKSDLGIHPDTLLITSVSSLTIEKGHKYLIDALFELKREISNFHLIIVGDGTERSNIKQQVKKLNLTKKVTLLGKRSDIDTIHAATDIYTLPSLNEGMPMSLLEAMASGVCVVATDVGDVAKCIHHNKTGILIKPFESKALYHALKSLCLDPELRHRLGDAASTLVQSKFSTNIMMRKYSKLYDEMLSVDN